MIKIVYISLNVKSKCLKVLLLCIIEQSSMPYLKTVYSFLIMNYWKLDEIK